MEDISVKICAFIYEEWMLKEKSQRSFAKKFLIDESVARKMKKVALSRGTISYDIPLSTIQHICTAKSISFVAFFRLIESYQSKGGSKG
ncbi:transcriptional regulator [Myroides sp. C15-4]|uniref:transcriptional regulator n=1 Tax=Myroides sp. C15-4 TaxID=3400532 RepID=UPI003D2F83A8